MSDDWMFNPATRYARTGLIDRITTDNPFLVDGEVTCDQAPLIIKGATRDGRKYQVRARYGHATFAVFGDDETRTVGRACSEPLAVGNTDEAAELVAALVADFHR